MRTGSGRDCFEAQVGQVYFRAQWRVAQAEVPSGTGICRRRIHPAVKRWFRDWRPVAGLLRERKAYLRGTRGDWIHTKDSRYDSCPPRSIATKEFLVRRGPARRESQRDLGQAGACCRNRIFNMDARQPGSAGGVQRSPGRQARRRSGSGNRGWANRSRAFIAGAENRKIEWPARWKGGGGDEGAGNHASRQGAGSGKRRNEAATRRVLHGGGRTYDSAYRRSSHQRGALPGRRWQSLLLSKACWDGTARRRKYH